MKKLLSVLLFAALVASAPAQVSLPYSDPPVQDVSLPHLLEPDTSGVSVSTRPHFVWTQAAGESLYVVQVASDTALWAESVMDTVYGDTLYQWLRPLRNGTVYFGRVGAARLDSGFVFGPARRFVTCEAPVCADVGFPDLRLKESAVAVTWLRNPAPFSVSVDSAWSISRRFLVMTPLPVTVPPGDSVLLHVQHTARRLGEVEDSILFRTDEGEAGCAARAQSPPPVLLASSPQILFGTMAVTDSARGGVILVNDGSLNALSVRRVRTRTPFFHLVTDPPRVLEPGDSARLGVMFQIRGLGRDAFGNYVDTLLVESDGGFERVVLRGDSPPPRPGMEPPVLSFGDVAAQDTGVAVLRIFNSSINTLRVDSMRAGGREVRPAGGRVYVREGDTVAVQVRFVPVGHGVVVDTLVLHTNAWRGEFRVPVTATVPYPAPDAGVSRIDFGPVARGDTGKAVIGIGNTSISRLRVDSIRTRARGFLLGKPTLPAVVERGDTLQFVVWFLPDSVRNFADTLVIVTNGRERVLKIPLRGDGVRPGAAGGRGGMPGEFELFQNFPNPFNATTTFRYALPEPSHVRFEVFTTLGQQVAVLLDGYQDAGYHNLAWTADVTSGVYYYRILATPRSDPGKNFSGTKKMVVMR